MTFLAGIVIFCVSVGTGILIGMGTSAEYGIAAFFLFVGVLSFFYGIATRVR
jgi:hypothetical protein